VKGARGGRGDPGSRRASRRRQDLPRRVGGPRPWTLVRARGTRRRAGRSGDPRPPPDLCRLAARTSRAGAARGRHHEPGHPPRRGGQARSDFRGDPSSALLEVLDPAQNHTFRDHYLEVELDCRRCCSSPRANVIDTVPGPLLDRMEVIRLDGYTEDEKVAIARHHLLPRQVERAALRPDEVTMSDAAVRTVIADYTREAGVRSLERELGRLLRKVATKLAAGDLTAPIHVEEGMCVVGWVGPVSSSSPPIARRFPGGDRPGGDRNRRRRPLCGGDVCRGHLGGSVAHRSAR